MLGPRRDEALVEQARELLLDGAVGGQAGDDILPRLLPAPFQGLRPVGQGNRTGRNDPLQEIGVERTGKGRGEEVAAHEDADAAQVGLRLGLPAVAHHALPGGHTAALLDPVDVYQRPDQDSAQRAPGH